MSFKVMETRKKIASKKKSKLEKGKSVKEVKYTGCAINIIGG